MTAMTWNRRKETVEQSSKVLRGCSKNLDKNLSTFSEKREIMEIEEAYLIGDGFLPGSE